MIDLPKSWHVYCCHVYFFLQGSLVYASSEQHFVLFDGLACLACDHMDGGSRQLGSMW